MPVLRPFSRPPKLLGRVLIALVLVMVGLAYGYASRSQETAAQRLAGMLVAERFTAGRLARQTAWQECVPVDTAALVPRVRCGAPPDRDSRRFRRIEELAHATRAVPQPDSSPAALRARALVDLRYADTSTVALEHAAASLEQALRLAPDDAGLLNELGVAYLALGQRTQQLTPMLRALDAVERAVGRDSMRVEILFNRALVLQRLYLIASAERAWARYLAVERDPRWRAEAQAHARWVAQVPDTVSWDALLTAPPARLDAATRAAIDDRVRRSPQKAREFGFPLLAAWGTAGQAGDTARAAQLLAVAREIGEAERALGVDQSVRLAVDAIDAARAEPGRIRQLASGHVGLWDGMRLYSADDNDRAVQVLGASEASLRAGESPAWRWAAFYRGAASVNRVDYEAGDRLLVRLVEQAGPQEPALAGKAIWALGLSQLRRGNYARANEHYERAAPHVSRSGERENVGAIAVLLAEGRALAGTRQVGSRDAYRALRLLMPYRRSGYLNNHLAIVGSYARDLELRHAALAVTRELVHFARGIDRPTTTALALGALVRELTAVGHLADAQAAADEAVAWADSIPDGQAGNRVRARVKLILGQLTRTRDPAAALPILAQAVSAYSEFQADFYLPTALHEAAQAAHAAGDRRRAFAWLRQAIEHLEGQQATFQSTEARATFYESVENVFDAAIVLEMEENRPASGFRMLERGRVHALAPDARGSVPPATVPASLAGIADTLPPGMLFIEYALLPDRLVAWTAARGRIRYHTIPIHRDSVARVVDRFARWASGASADGAAAARAYDVLLRPLADDLRGMRTLAIVPDRELYRAPFAALLNPATGRFLVQDHDIRTLPSAGFFVAASARARRPTTTRTDALIVGNPTVHPRDAALLPPLPGAVREAETIGRLYPGSTVLTEAHARRGRVLQSLPAHAIFHFAGHAVLDPDRPEQSYLVLAADAPEERGFLRAWEIGGLRLSNLQVAVLSACSSLSPRTSRTGAVAGLAYSFLRAGVPATVSTLWDVDDAATTELVVALHRHLAAGIPAAEALRRTQVDALTSPRRELRDPRAWAALIYTGP